MNVSFYFDPGCPWCWITSRWITQVSEDRSIEVTFKPFSLAMKNDLLDKEDAHEYGPAVNRSHKLLRVCERIREDYGNDKVDEFYTRAGAKIHIDADHALDWVTAVCEEIGVDPSVVEALTDTRYDDVLKKSLASAIEIAGDDVGVPLFAIEDESGSRGFFGPVISEMPSKEEGLALWDGISAMVSFPSFFELKRTRDVDANTQSTRHMVK
jgi:hypothetical protein